MSFQTAIVFKHMHVHNHNNHPAWTSNQGRVLSFCIAANLVFVAVEAVLGYRAGSMSLLSDAGHNLGDVFSLVLVAVGARLAKAKATDRYTYGYKKSTVLISLLNAIVLLVAVGAIIVESLRKFGSPTAVDGPVVMWTALAGIAVNGLTAWLLMGGDKRDLNMHGAYVHMLADMFVSLGVVVSGAAISVTGWGLIDPVVGLAVAAAILASTWHLLSGSIRLSLDGLPEGVDLLEVERAMAAVPGVADVHHVHVWALSTTENALTSHVVLKDIRSLESVKKALKETLRGKDITHTTIEFEIRQACGDVLLSGGAS